MPIIFKSQRSTDVLMLEVTGRQVLSLLGKDPEAVRGVVTVEQLPAAIATLQAAIARDKSEHAEDLPGDDPEDPGQGGEAPVRLFQRMVPVLELLQSAARQAAPVTWGV